MKKPDSPGPYLCALRANLRALFGEKIFTTEGTECITENGEVRII